MRKAAMFEAERTRFGYGPPMVRHLALRQRLARFAAAASEAARHSVAAACASGAVAQCHRVARPAAQPPRRGLPPLAEAHLAARAPGA